MEKCDRNEGEEQHKNHTQQLYVDLLCCICYVYRDETAIGHHIKAGFLIPKNQISLAAHRQTLLLLRKMDTLLENVFMSTLFSSSPFHQNGKTSSRLACHGG